LAGRRVVVWRHGRTDWNHQRRFQGQVDVGLDELGVEQARAAAAVLATLKPAKLVSSDLTRARTTAQALVAATGLPLNIDPGFREISVGNWEGLTLEQVAERDPAGAELWLSGREGRRGGGETMSEVAVRARSALDRALVDVGPDQTLVVTTHGAAGRALLSSLMGLPTELWHSVGSLANACWSIALDTPDGWRLAEHNVGPNQYEAIQTEPPAGDDR
jgi:broad specificity phosphatase PhoE